MFTLFKKKSPAEKLYLKYNKLQKKAFELSKTNRKESDKFYSEAMKLMEQIEKLKNEQ